MSQKNNKILRAVFKQITQLEGVRVIGLVGPQNSVGSRFLKSIPVVRVVDPSEKKEQHIFPDIQTIVIQRINHEDSLYQRSMIKKAKQNGVHREKKNAYLQHRGKITKFTQSKK